LASPSSSSCSGILAMIVYIQVTDTLGSAKLTIIGENPYT